MTREAKEREKALAATASNEENKSMHYYTRSMHVKCCKVECVMAHITLTLNYNAKVGVAFLSHTHILHALGK